MTNSGMVAAQGMGERDVDRLVDNVLDRGWPHTPDPGDDGGGGS